MSVGFCLKLSRKSSVLEYTSSSISRFHCKIILGHVLCLKVAGYLPQHGHRFTERTIKGKKENGNSLVVTSFSLLIVFLALIG